MVKLGLMKHMPAKEHKCVLIQAAQNASVALAPRIFTEDLTLVLKHVLTKSQAIM